MIEYLLGGGPRYPSRYRFVEVLSVLVYVGLGARVATDAAHAALSNPLALWLLVPVIMCGYVATDFFSGLLHWLADTYATSSTPFWGPKFVRPFREHHTDPKGITRHDFIEANGDNCLLGVIVLAPVVTFVSVRETTLGLCVAFFALSMSSALLVTSLAHGWAHADHPPAVARALQRLGLIVSPSHHAIHHVAPHKSHYCITAGWMNPLLDRIRFFRHMERVLRAVGIRPGADTEEVDAVSPPKSRLLGVQGDADQCEGAPEPTASSMRANPEASRS